MQVPGGRTTILGLRCHGHRIREVQNHAPVQSSPPRSSASPTVPCKGYNSFLPSAKVSQAGDNDPPQAEVPPNARERRGCVDTQKIQGDDGLIRSPRLILV